MKKVTIENTDIYINKIIPFPGFLAMAVYGVIFWQEKYADRLESPKWESSVKKTINHENIHKAQMMDFCKWLPLGGTIFYFVYIIEWLMKLILCLFVGGDSYRNLSAEIEAFDNASDFEYLTKRKKFGWLKKFFHIQIH